MFSLVYLLYLYISIYFPFKKVVNRFISWFYDYITNYVISVFRQIVYKFLIERSDSVYVSVIAVFVNHYTE